MTTFEMETYLIEDEDKIVIYPHFKRLTIINDEMMLPQQEIDIKIIKNGEK